MHMTKCVALCGIVFALVWVGVVAAATPQGQLTGTATFGCCTIPGISVTTTVIDGGTSSVGLENDRSGNCAGDSGVVQGPGPGGSDISHTIRCAHYVASSRDGSGPKMRFAYTFFEPAGNFYSVVVYRISDGGARGTDKVGFGFQTAFDITTARLLAKEWVNLGQIGSGNLGWNFVTLTSGGFTVTP